MHKETLCNPTGGMAHCHCPSVATTPNGDVFVAWYAYPEEETRGAILMLARKESGATRFSPANHILSSLTRTAGNPVLFPDVCGTLHLLFVVLNGHYWNAAIALSSKSSDQGKSWSTPEVMRLPEGTMVRHPPVARRNGYLLLPAYDEKTNRTVILTSDPEATGWFPVTHFEDSSAIQGSLVRQSETDLTILFRPSGEHRVCLRALSGDDGGSWSPPIRTTLPNPLSGVAAFVTDGKLCAVYNHTTEHRRYPLSISWSDNYGTAWSDPVHIDQAQHEVSYPAFVVDSKGVVHGAYTQGRDSITYIRFDSSSWMR